MSAILIAQKVKMSQLFNEQGVPVPVTLLHSVPCTVTALRKSGVHGYTAIQVGLPRSKKIDNNAKKVVYRKKVELRLGDGADVELKEGDTVSPEQFKTGDKVTIIGTSKGKGFQGVVKRHGFAGAPASHGTKHTLRAPGSIGSRFPQHVRKGLKMAGRMGQDRHTTKNVEIILVDVPNNTIAVKGQVPGARGSFVTIQTT